MKSDEKPVMVRVFTHPVCTTCHYAIELAQELSMRRNDLDVQVVSLANEKGLNEARDENVLSVPTVIIGKASNRCVGVPKREELIRAIDEEKNRLIINS
jgi:glutaredoxin